MFKRFISVPLILILTLAVSSKASAQCTTANINWDNMDYLQRNAAMYSSYITAALYNNMVQTQRFAIGTNRLTIATNFATAGILGENITHTGHTGGFGVGADAAFNSNGTMTFTFDTAVSNVQFSIYDLDVSQVATVTALEGAASRAVTLAAPGGNVTIAGNIATGAVTNYGNAVNNATLNITVAGPLTSITIVFTGTAGDFWLSDISACVYRNFPTDYYRTPATPWTNQPSWVLAVHDRNTIFMVDPATGRAVSLFTDNTPRVGEINDLAYDPYNHVLYYSVDGLERANANGLGPNGPPDSVRYLRKYDFNTETISQVINNVNNPPFNIPTFYYGLESGSAAFYGGSLYLGVEGTQSGSSSTGREGIIWRIDMDGSNSPYQASQVFAFPVDNGSSLLHDWGDIIIRDGVMYDFNAASASGNGVYNICDLQTNNITASHTGTALINKPRQAAQQYDGQLVWMHDSVAYYNGTNVLTPLPKRRIVSALRSVGWIAGAGDASEAFKPKSDFGDAPATYDPVALSPAVHERDSALFLGPAVTGFTAGWDWEWNKQTSADATGDGSDENGLAFVPFMPPSAGVYLAQVSLYNHTGSDATLIAWLDFNGNNQFDAAEAITPITVPSLTTNQQFWLYWPSTPNTFVNGQQTFLRIRVTTGTMTSAHATGYYADGEVEDYRVIVDNYPMAVDLLSFDAKAVNNSTARLTWRTTGEENLTGFDIERSADGTNFSYIGYVQAKGTSRSSINDYIFNDVHALQGRSYYRLKLKNAGGSYTYSEVRSIVINNLVNQVSIMPNPARSQATVYVVSNSNKTATVVLLDMQGKQLRKQTERLVSGGNSISINGLEQYPEGTYIVQLITGDEIVSKKLVIGRNF